MFLDIEKELFQKILIKNCKKLSIKEISMKEQQPFIEKVDQILALKKS
jgi:adenine-specific DNA-methyltransferase